MQFESSKVEYDESLHYFEDMTHSSQRNFDTLSKRMNEQMEEILLKDKQVEELNSRVKQLLTQGMLVMLLRNITVTNDGHDSIHCKKYVRGLGSSFEC
jgi:phage-related tail protein